MVEETVVRGRRKEVFKGCGWMELDGGMAVELHKVFVRLELRPVERNIEKKKPLFGRKNKS